MKLPNIKILEDNNKILKQKSSDVTFPLSTDDKDLIEDLIVYLTMSQDDKYIKEYKLRAGMGMAFIQLGLPKRIFVIAYLDEETGLVEEHRIINPKIVSNSSELIYVEEGEGCLSINRSVDGIVPRYARCTIEYFDIDGNPKRIRVREEMAVAFQHEIDHLNGILFTDRIDKTEPYKNMDNMRSI